MNKFFQLFCAFNSQAILSNIKILFVIQTFHAAQYNNNNKSPIKRWAEDLNIHFSSEDIEIAKKHMKRCSTLLLVREMQIKTTVRYHLTPVCMAIIKKSTNNKCWWQCREKGTLLHCWWEYKLVKLLWRTIWRLLKKLKIELLYDPAIPLLGIYPVKTVIQKDACTQCTLQHSLQKPGHGSNLHVHQQSNG